MEQQPSYTQEKGSEGNSMTNTGKNDLLLLMDQRDSMVKDVAEKIIEYCRFKEKQKSLGKLSVDEIGGIETMQQLVNNGTLTVFQYLKMIPAVEYFDTPYNLNIKIV